jgi:hypothetical protein
VANDPTASVAAASAVDDDKRREFHIEEFKALREEIASNMSRSVAMLQYVLLGSAAVYSFLVGFGEKDGSYLEHVPRPGLYILWLTPFILCVMGALNHWSSVRYIQSVGRYLLKIENGIGLPSLGWEKHFSLDFAKNRFKQFDAMNIFWWIVLALNGVCGCYGLHSLIYSGQKS